MESDWIALAPAVARLHAALGTLDHPDLAAVGMAADQWRVLDQLVRRGPRSMSQLAVATGLTGPTATRVADHLVERALVYRRVDPHDRRRIVMEASKRGQILHRKVAPELAEQMHATVAAVWERLADDERHALRYSVPIDVPDH